MEQCSIYFYIMLLVRRRGVCSFKQPGKFLSIENVPY